MTTGLLMLAAKLAEIMQGFSGFFANFHWIYGVEIFFFFVLIFFVSKVLRDNDATKLMLVYWAVIIVVGAFNVFDSELIGDEFFLFFVLLVSAFMLILFNVEVKKSLWDVHSSKDVSDKSTGGSTEIRTQADTERCISNVIKALQNMSKNNVGALIVLSRGSLPKQVLQSGVEIDAEISTQLIEGIFFPKAPLHDGAMIIHGHKIQAAGVFLAVDAKDELSQGIRYAPSRGNRYYRSGKRNFFGGFGRNGYYLYRQSRQRDEICRLRYVDRRLERLLLARNAFNG